MRHPHVFVLLVTVASGGSAAAQPLTIYEIGSSRGFRPHVARFTPDSRYVLMAGEMITSSGRQPELRVWDVEARVIVGEHRLNRVGGFVSLDVAFDGRTLLMGTIDYKKNGTHESSLWDWSMQSGASRGPRVRSSLNHVRQLTVGVYDFCVDAEFSSDGTLVGVTRTGGSDPHTGKTFSQIEWMRSSGELLHSVASPPRIVTDKAFSPDGGTLATSVAASVEVHKGDVRRQIEIVLWDVESGKEKEQASVTDTLTPRYVSRNTRVAFSPDGRLIASDGPDWSIQLWSVDTLEPQARLEGLQSHLSAVQFSPDGRLVVGASNRFGEPLCIWSRESGHVLWKYDQPDLEWEGAAFSPDGNWLVTRAMRLRDNNKISGTLVQLWDVHFLLGVGGDESGALQ
jgi:WD40 repeat protein